MLEVECVCTSSTSLLCKSTERLQRTHILGTLTSQPPSEFNLNHNHTTLISARISLPSALRSRRTTSSERKVPAFSNPTHTHVEGCNSARDPNPSHPPEAIRTCLWEILGNSGKMGLCGGLVRHATKFGRGKSQFREHNNRIILSQKASGMTMQPQNAKKKSRLDGRLGSNGDFRLFLFFHWWMEVMYFCAACAPFDLSHYGAPTLTPHPH